MRWSYCSFELSHRVDDGVNFAPTVPVCDIIQGLREICLNVDWLWILSVLKHFLRLRDIVHTFWYCRWAICMFFLLLLFLYYLLNSLAHLDGTWLEIYVWYSNIFFIDILSSTNKISFRWMLIDLAFVICQHWYRFCLGIVRQQAITWTSVDLC